MTREFVGMPRKKGPWLVLGGILALVGALWLLREPVSRTARRPPAEESVEPSASSTFVAPDSRPSVRQASPTEALASPPPELSADPRLDWLRGTVVDAAGTPVGGANVVVLRGAYGDNTLLFQLDPSFRSGFERTA